MYCVIQGIKNLNLRDWGDKGDDGDPDRYLHTIKPSVWRQTYRQLHGSVIQLNIQMYRYNEEINSFL